MAITIQSTLKKLTSFSLILALSSLNVIAFNAGLAGSAELPLKSTTQSDNDCKDNERICDKLTLSHQREDMSNYTRYRGKVDWNNAYRRFGYGNSLRFQKVTELDWQQEGNGGRSFDVFKKEATNTPAPDAPKT